jgi:hypothetical protein
MNSLSMERQPLVDQGLPKSELYNRTHTHTTVGRISLEELSARHRDFSLKTHNTFKRHTSMPLAGFKPAIPASERPQTHALDLAATGIGNHKHYCI